MRLEARCAGRQVAAAVTSVIAINTAAARLAASDRMVPANKPAASTAAASRRVKLITDQRPAPRARRMPISLVRRATVEDMTPYNPTAVRAAARAPNSSQGSSETGEQRSGRFA